MSINDSDKQEMKEALLGGPPTVSQPPNPISQPPAALPPVAQPFPFPMQQMQMHVQPQSQPGVRCPSLATLPQVVPTCRPLVPVPGGMRMEQVFVGQQQQQVMAVPSGQGVAYGQVPMRIVCQFCGHATVTRIEPTPGLLTLLLAGGLAMLGCVLGCCLVPFCVEDCQDLLHRCSNCGSVVGKYSRLSGVTAPGDTPAIATPTKTEQGQSQDQPAMVPLPLGNERSPPSASGGEEGEDAGEEACSPEQKIARRSSLPLCMRQCSAGGAGMAMVYSPSLQGNVPVQPLPLAQLQLGTDKVFKFRTFSLFLELNSAYVRKVRLTEDDVYKAGLNAKCLKDSAPDQELFSCPICSPKKKIIEVDVSNRQIFGPRRTPYGTEVYTFDMCKTNCSSSRDHHKSRLVIAIDTLPGTGTIASLPFIVQAREKHQGLKRDKGSVVTSPAPRAMSPSISLSGQLALAASSSPEPVAVGGAERLKVTVTDMDGATLSERQLQAIEGATNKASTFPPGDVAMVVAGGGGATQTQKVKVLLLSSTMTSSDTERLMASMADLLKALPGYCQFKWSVLPGMAIGFSFFDTEEHHQESMELMRSYLVNSNGVINVFNRNLVADGITALLAVCNSW